ncbi:hypothetical protein [Streptomyces sp. PTD5-9]
MGATGFPITGYGGCAEPGVARAVLVAAVLLRPYRTRARDRRTAGDPPA